MGNWYYLKYIPMSGLERIIYDLLPGDDDGPEIRSYEILCRDCDTSYGYVNNVQSKREAHEKIERDNRLGDQCTSYDCSSDEAEDDPSNTEDSDSDDGDADDSEDDSDD